MRVRSCGLALGAALLLAAPVSAAELVTGQDYPPFVDEAAPEGGLAVDLVRQAYLAVGVEATVRFLPWRRGYDDTLRGLYAATFPYLRNPDRERDFLYSAPLYPVRLMLFHIVRGFRYAGLGSLKGKTTCIEFGGIPQRPIRTLVQAGDVLLVETQSILGCVRMMAVGRVDFVVVNEQVGRAAIADAGVSSDTIAMEPEPFALMSQHLLVPRAAADAAAQIALFDRGLAILKESGRYAVIMGRHPGAS